MRRGGYCPPRPELVEGELTLHIVPRMSDSWEGTAAQLIEEGLIPDEFEWPVGTGYYKFTHAGFECSIERRRRPGSGRGAWGHHDWWRVCRLCRGRGGGASTLFQMQEALRWEMWRRGPIGMAMVERTLIAWRDKDFQAFKTRWLGLRPPR